MINHIDKIRQIINQNIRHINILKSIKNQMYQQSLIDESIQYIQIINNRLENEINQAIKSTTGEK